MSKTALTPDGGPQSARDILDTLHSNASVARVAAQIATGDGDATAQDVHRTLALAEDRLCLTVTHAVGTEYIWLADGWQTLTARLHRERDGATVDVALSPADLAHRLEKPIDVALVGATPVSRPESTVEGSR